MRDQEAQAEGARYLKIAVDQGHGGAQAVYGAYLVNVPRDGVAGGGYLRRAAYVLALKGRVWTIDRCLQERWGVTEVKDVVRYLKMGADGGNFDAMELDARCM